MMQEIKQRYSEWLTIMFITCAMHSFAQVPSSYTGTVSNNSPISGAGHNYIHLLSETVDPSSGNVSATIPFPVRPGRGITFPLTSYLSIAPYQLTQNITTGVIEFENHPPPGPATATWTETTFSMGVPNGQSTTFITCNWATGFTFTGLDNVTHKIQLAVTETQPSEGPFSCIGGGNGVTGTVAAPEGDTLEVNAAFTSPTATANAVANWGITGSPLTPVNGSVGAFTVTDQNGTTYFFDGDNGQFDSATNIWTNQANTIEDRNGNKITMSTPAGQCGASYVAYCDTTGQQVGAGVANSVTTQGSPTVSYSVPHVLQNGTEAGYTYGCLPTTYGWEVTGANAGYTPPGEYVVGIGSVPSGNSYQIYYHLYYGTYNPTDSSIGNNYGLINEIVFPDGGWVKYAYPQTLSSEYNQMFEYGGTLTGTKTAYGCAYLYTTPQVATRTVSYDGSNPALTQSFTYQTSWPGAANNWTSKTTTVLTTDKIANTSYLTTYTYAPGVAPLEQVITHYAGATTSTAVLETETKGWADQYHLACDIVTISNGSEGHFYTWDPTYYQMSDDKQYDYGIITNPSSICNNGTNGALTASPPSSFTRDTKTAFEQITNPFGMNYGKPSSVIVTNSAGTTVAETDYSYDLAAIANAPTTATNHDDGVFPVAQSKGRGNPTTVIRKCLQSCNNSDTTYTYDLTGQVATMTDPCGYANGTPCSDMPGQSSYTTFYLYTDNPSNGDGAVSSNAYLTSVTRPTTSDGVAHVESFQYDYPSGNLIESKDENGQPSTYSYSDPLLRITDSYEPALPSGTEPHTQYAYVDGTNASITVTNPLGGTTTSSLNGMGMPVRSQIEYSSTATQITDTTYNGAGQVQTVSNPYFTTSDTSYGVTSSVYDALGRKTLQLQPDNITTTSTVNGSSSTNYSSALQWQYTGNVVGFTDESGNSWQRTSDGLGRLTNVTEPGGLQTAYTYDLLDNLLTVTQSGTSSETLRTRSFNYNSLSRLVCASNPENSSSSCPTTGSGPFPAGTTRYSYDVNGNVSSKVTPAVNTLWGSGSSTTTTYIYDSLNRLLSKGSGGFLTSCFLYDGAIANGTGRLVDEWSQSGACATSLPSSGFYSLRAIAAYDAEGHIASEQQCTPGSCSVNAGPQLWYGYDAAGNTTCLANSAGAPNGTNLSVGSPACLKNAIGTPSGLLLTSQFDVASHATSMTSNWSAFPTSLYTLQTNTGSSYGYGPVGPLYWKAGSGLSLTQSYTNRLRVNTFGATSITPD